VTARIPGYRHLRQPVAGRATRRCWQTGLRPAVAVGIPASGVVGMAGRLPRPMAVGSGDHSRFARRSMVDWATAGPVPL
jgi:hypothetical protein